MKKASMTLLVAIIAAMQNTAAPYGMATKVEAAELVKDGFAEFNDEIAEGDKFAIRATEKGIAAVPTETSTDAAQVAPSTNAFAIIKGLALPTKATRARAETYPFDGMDVGDSFFVPASDKKPNPAKSLASTVSSATKRFATEVEGQTRTTRKGKVIPVTVNTRVFAVAAVTEGQTIGEWKSPSAGALVQRTA